MGGQLGALWERGWSSGFWSRKLFFTWDTEARCDTFKSQSEVLNACDVACLSISPTYCGCVKKQRIIVNERILSDEHQDNPCWAIESRGLMCFCLASPYKKRIIWRQLTFLNALSTVIFCRCNAVKEAVNKSGSMPTIFNKKSATFNSLESEIKFCHSRVLAISLKSWWLWGEGLYTRQCTWVKAFIVWILRKAWPVAVPRRALRQHCSRGKWLATHVFVWMAAAFVEKCRDKRWDRVFTSTTKALLRQIQRGILKSFAVKNIRLLLHLSSATNVEEQGNASAKLQTRCCDDSLNNSRVSRFWAFSEQVAEQPNVNGLHRVLEDK